jgi:hypothetical protein
VAFILVLIMLTFGASSNLMGKGKNELGEKLIIKDLVGYDEILMDSIKVINPKSFGIHVRQFGGSDKPRTPLHPEIGYKSIRLWDTGTNWRNIERSKGVFDWARLDDLVNKARKSGFEILYCMGQPPNWATGGLTYGDSLRPSINTSGRLNGYPPVKLQDWADFVTTLAKRYKGKIKYYEVWNEPNNQPYFVGTIDELINLTKTAYRALKAVDSTIQVVSASPTRSFKGVEYMDAYLAGAKDYIDIVGVHLYMHPEQPEKQMDLIEAYKNVMTKHGIKNKPIWDTESTWHTYKYNGNQYKVSESNNTDVMPPQLAASYIMRYFICHWALGVERTYFYGTDAFWSALRIINKNNLSELTAAGHSFQRISSWLSGAKMLKFYRHQDGYYAVILTYKNGSRAMIVWTEDGIRYDMSVPLSMGIYKIISGDGNPAHVNLRNNKKTIEINNIPTLLRFSKPVIELPSPVYIE